MDKEISIGAIVYKKFDDQFKFLILKRSDNSIWEFPKGHVENNEKELETLNREIYEELGIKGYRLIPDFREVISYTSSRGVVREFIFYLIDSNEEIKRSDEHCEHKWITINEVSNYFEYDDIKNLLKSADRIIHAL